MLAHEAWLGLRVSARGDSGFVRVHERARTPSALYTVFDWHGGRTLEQMQQARRARRGGRGRRPRPSRWPRALGRLHRHGVVHRDIKPGNLHLGDDGRWRILDLGVALSGRESAAAARAARRHAELHQPRAVGAARGGRRRQRPVRARRHALPVARPAGCPTARSSPTRRRATGATRPRCRASGPTCRSGSTTWCCKAVARDPRQRFETAEELLLALERGASRPSARRAPRR